MAPNAVRVFLFVCSGGFASTLVLWVDGAHSELSHSGRDLLADVRSLSALTSDARPSPWARLECIVSDTFLTEQAADSILVTTDESVLIAFLAKLPEQFWEGHPNANVLGRALGRKWGSTMSSSFWWPKTNQVLASINVDAKIHKRLLIQVVTGALEVAKLVPAQVELLLRQCTNEEAKSVIEAYAATSSYSSPQNALNDLLKVWQAGVQEANPSERRFLALIALRYHVSRLKNADDFIQYTELAACGSDFDSALLENVAMFRPAIYEACLIAFGNKDPKRTAELARHTVIPAGRLKELLEKMGGGKDEFLREYLVGLSIDSPQAAADLADALPAAELPLHCRAVILHAMLCLGGGNVDKWLASFSQKERAESLDALDSSDWSRAEKLGLQSNLARSYLRYRLTLPDAENIRDGHPADTHLGRAIEILARDNIEDVLSLLGPLPSETKEEMTALAYHNRASRLRVRGQMEDCYDLIEHAPASIVPDLLGSSLPFAKDMETAVAAMDRFQLTNEARAKVMDELLGSGILSVDLQTRQEAILAWIKTSPSVSPKGAIEFVLDECVETNPASGSSWILRMPPGPAREHAVSFYVTKWASFDPVSASEWIAKMPAGSERDLAAKELVSSSMDDLEIAFANAVAISDPVLQFDAASQVVRTWCKIDPRSAFNYLENSSLPRDVVQRLQATVPAAFLSIQ